MKTYQLRTNYMHVLMILAFDLLLLNFIFLSFEHNGQPKISQI